MRGTLAHAHGIDAHRDDAPRDHAHRDHADLFVRIGTFLSDQRLGVDPVTYAFAHHILSDPDGSVAAAVARLTDGGCRLQRDDIEGLIGRTVPGPAGTRDGGAMAEDDAYRLVADTRAQVDDFASIMRTMQDETRDFGRDLAARAAAITTSRAGTDSDGIARIARAMLARIHDAEARLERATDEADTLRAKLAEANDTARRDALTGLPNRRAFEEAFATRDADGSPYCLAVCDIDRFKRINDGHGHAVGDRVLSAVARTLADACGDDLVVRHGGEEFAILLRGVDLAAAAAKLDDVRATIAAKRFRARDSGQSLGTVTISIGVTAVCGQEATDAALDRADRMLYTAKANGRDQVIAA